MQLRNYVLVTAGYWAFTLTDGALRMLVLLHFHDLGYSAVAIAFLFLLYEFMGIITNLIGGWVTDMFDWRTAFFVVGLPGLLIAAVFKFTVKEPPRGYTDPVGKESRDQVAMSEAIRELTTKPAFWYMTAGATVAANGWRARRGAGIAAPAAVSDPDGRAAFAAG